PATPGATAAPSPTPQTPAAAPTIERSSALVDAVREVLPAVVTIVTSGSDGQPRGSGTGVVIDRTAGYVATNSHVIEDARTTRATGTFSVILHDGSSRPATLIGNDPDTDVAVLRVEGDLPAEARLATADVPLGTEVIAIGSPGTPGRGGGTLLTNTVTSGIVSAIGRSLPRPDLRSVVLQDLVQTDAPINTGMSGGPLVAVATREVIGLATLVLRGSGEEGLGFAVSATTVRRVSAELIARATN
ncbi:MAG: S1C family serine protease, partial [Candidatus Limnocylindria bacterium]